jgi:hypothetical protein
MRITAKTKNLFTAAVLAVSLCAMPRTSSAGVAISITIAPPVLPVYVQPPCPAEGYLWTPGYWAYGPYGYYWVPGVWVRPPRIGFLWTPGYWAFVNSAYFWQAGYWGPHVGFYGSVNYGFGYTGLGFVGGYWSGSAFRYNTAVTNVNTTVIRNVYVDRTVVHNATANRASFNGRGGIMARPSAREEAAFRERHFQPTANQVAHEQTAGRDRSQFASFNHGHPSVVAMESVNGRRFTQQGRVANSGTLAAEGKQQVNRQPNNLSRSIPPDKHTGSNAQYGNNRAGERSYEQQQRASQGVHSGQMSPSEAARTEHRDQSINHQVNADRHANGERPPAERNNVNREQNHTSRQVNEEKHNEKTAPR